MTIVTAPDGTRYRLGERIPDGQSRDANTPIYLSLRSQALTPNGTYINDEASDGPGYEVEVLPRIPNWPLPGPAPQYLYSTHSGEMVDNPDGTRTMVFPYGELREGDTVLSLDVKGRWHIETLTASQAEHCKYLTAWIDWEYVYSEDKRPQDAWLITRKDPEASE